MRIRIALATAVAVTFMIVSFIVFPGVAHAATTQPSSRQQSQQQGQQSGQPGGLAGESSYILTVMPAPGSAGTPAAVTSRSVANHLLWVEWLGTTARWAPAVATTVATSPAPPVTDATSTDTPDWQCIRVEESGDEYHDPARPSGAYGILEITWLSNGDSGWPYQASSTLQDALALKLYQEYGWVPWSSRFACGLG